MPILRLTGRALLDGCLVFSDLVLEDEGLDNHEHRLRCRSLAEHVEMSVYFWVLQELVGEAHRGH